MPDGQTENLRGEIGEPAIHPRNRVDSKGVGCRRTGRDPKELKDKQYKNFIREKAMRSKLMLILTQCRDALHLSTKPFWHKARRP